MTIPSLRSIAVLAAFGATLGSVLDGFHTWSGTTSYPSPIALRMAWWTPLLFAVAYASLGSLFTFLRARDPSPGPSGRRAILGFAGFTALYFASGFLPASNAVKLIVLLAGAVSAYLLVDKSPAAIVAGLVASAIGPLTEVTLVSLGAFTHLQPDFAGIPMWLPALYLASGPAGGPFARWLTGAVSLAATPSHASSGPSAA